MTDKESALGKKFDQFGRDVTETLEKEKSMEFVQIKVTREDLDKMYEERMDRYSKKYLTEQGQFLMALAHIQGAVALLAVTDKESAKKAMADSVGDLAYHEGRAAAEVRGFPTDLDSYERYQEISFESAPFIPYTVVLEDSNTRYVAGGTYCPWADSIRKLAKMFPDYVTQDVIEVVASRCDKLDSGRVEGFNPGFKFRRLRFILDDLIGNPPSDGCFFEFEK
jgi:hypothetical protein